MSAKPEKPWQDVPWRDLLTEQQQKAIITLHQTGFWGTTMPDTISRIIDRTLLEQFPRGIPHK